MWKSILRKIVPKRVRNLIHWFYAYLGACKYRNPSEELFTIGVTGTSGKSTTIYLLRQILEKAGYTVGYLSTIDFYVAGKQMPNDERMTMLGKTRTHKFLRQMADEGCDVAILEMTSEGYLQRRHCYINFDTAVFTNLYPEHIESHGGFKNYKEAKLALFKYVSKCKSKYRLNKYQKITLCNLVDNVAETCAKVPKTCIVNANSEHAKDFLAVDFERKSIFGVLGKESQLDKKDLKDYSPVILASRVKVEKDSLQIEVDGKALYAHMHGEHTAMNILAAVSTAVSMGVGWDDIVKAVVEFTDVPGRIEFIAEAEKFGYQVMVDFAFEPAGLETLYKVVDQIKPKRIIQVCGSAGGGRDKARREPIGRLVGGKADIFIITNEDSFDEDPLEIIKTISKGAQSVGKELGKDLFEIADRGEAINKAIELARPEDLVLVTGKGNEQKMFLKNGQTIDWDDRKVVREALRNTK